MLQNLLYAAVVIGALRVKTCMYSYPVGLGVLIFGLNLQLFPYFMRVCSKSCDFQSETFQILMCWLIS